MFQKSIIEERTKFLIRHLSTSNASFSYYLEISVTLSKTR